MFLRSRLGEGEARLSEHVSPERDAGRDSAVIWMFDVS